MKKVNKPAFTLAEVIVTIGLIGIIAAMTLSGLIKHWREYVTIKKNLNKLIVYYLNLITKWLAQTVMLEI